MFSGYVMRFYTHIIWNLYLVNKTEFYQELLAQTHALLHGETDLIANMANISALLFEALEQVNWVGFYRVIENELILGPFQGKVACIRIPIGKGVCGTAVLAANTQCVTDVHQFEGHIACDATTNSEIVIPVIVNSVIVAVLDLDSTRFERFDQEDQDGLEAIVEVLSNTIG